MARNHPLRNFRFFLEFDGIQQAGFSEVTIGETASDAVDYRTGDDPTHVHKLFGPTKFGNIPLTQGVTGSLNLYNWHRAIAAGDIQNNCKQVAIVVRDEAGEAKARFVISEAWPSKYDPGVLKAAAAEIFVERIEISHEGLERVAS